MPDPLAGALAHPDVRRLAASLAERPGADDVPRPGEPTPRRAAVALILRVVDGGVEVLFVKRAEYAGDATPWDTAARETMEETGLDLRRDGRPLGRLDELHPRALALPAIVVRPYVVLVPPDVALALTPELTRAFWVPVDRLRADAQVVSTVAVRGGAIRVPSVVHDGYVIWGMTFRIVEDFLARIPSRG